MTNTKLTIIVITLGSNQCDCNNQMITITDEIIAKEAFWDQILSEKGTCMTH